MPLRARVRETGVFIVAGRVVRVRARSRGGWRVRLADTGGALAVAEFSPSTPITLPPRGAYVVIRGPVVYDPVHAWYAIDPVEWWVGVHTSDAASDSGLFTAGHHRRRFGLAGLRP